jgi:hypothetical protein
LLGFCCADNSFLYFDSVSPTMATPPTAVTANFPFPVLTVFGTAQMPPNSTTLRVLQRECNSNAMSVHSNEGGGRHGHLTLTITAAKYLTVAGVAHAYPAPTAPPIHPVIPDGATAAVTSELVRQHSERVRTFQRYHDVDKALVRTIIAATTDTYIRAICDPDYGYANVTALQMLNHLNTTYGTITEADRVTNIARMSAPWAPPTPIEDLFDQLQEGSVLATLAAEPIPDTQLARMGYNLVIKTGLFDQACREWRLKADADRTFANFRLHFTIMDRDRLQVATTATAGYMGTAYCAAALGTNVPTTLATDDVQGAAFAATALPTGATLVTLLAELATFRAAATAARTGTPPAARGYCWTHGSTTNKAHTSATCLHKADGHIDTATFRNKQGGNTATYVPPPRRPRGSPAVSATL